MDRTQAVNVLIELALRGHGASVHLCNAYTLSLAERRPMYRELLNAGDLNLADGAPVAWFARRAGAGIEGPVRGKDLFVGTVLAGRSHGLRHYLYGSTREVVERAARNLVGAHEGATVVGAESPPFRELTGREVASLVERLLAARPHIVWLGLGTPKQDEFAERMKSVVPATFVAVGAAFDFVAGTKLEAPAWMHGTGLEWTHRLATEPRRLWRRYLIGNAVFLVGALRSTRRP